MPEYRAPRMRDAFGVIRGFVFQVDLTVARWLELQSDQELHLECGEDIDVAVRAVEGDDKAIRVLEQVKHRERSITLRDPSAVEAIANAIEHADCNPNLRIQFQFTSNGTAGRERPTPRVLTGPAIEAWEQIRTRARIGRDADLAVQAIRSLLAERPKPDTCPSRAWGRFREVVTAPDEEPFRRILDSFSWCLRVPGVSSLRERTVRSLIECGRASSEHDAVEQHRRLFIHVLDCLSRSGEKRLGLDDLDAILRLPALSGSEQRSLEAIFQRIDGLDDRLAAMSSKQEADRENLTARLDALATAQGVTAAIRHVVATPALKPPAPPVRLCRREATIRRLLPVLARCRWLELLGTIGYGKSELARLLAESAGGVRCWVDFRGLSVAAAALRLDAAVEMRVGPFTANSRVNAYTQFIATLGSGAVLVVDDLPERSDQDPLCERLIELLCACRANDVRVVTTATAATPARTIDRLPLQTYEQIDVPPFSNEEIAELLREFKAPADVLDRRRIRFISNATSGHPTLLVAAARYLTSRKWHLTKETLVELVRGTYANALRRDTVQTLIRVADAGARQMLYRLNLAVTTFAEADVVNLAAVPEPIDHPQERLEELIDVAIQRSPSGDLRVSPLFRLLGAGDVAPATRVGCHLVLGTAIMRRRTVGIDEAVAAVTHFLNGDDPTRAVIVLVRGMSSLLEHGGRVDASLLTMFWRDQPTPSAVDRGLRIVLRTNQIRLLKKVGQDFEYPLRELETLIGEADDMDAWAVLAAGVALNIIFVGRDIRRSHQYLLIALAALPVVERLHTGILSSFAAHPEELFWTTVTHISNSGDLDNWIMSVNALPEERRLNLFNADLADRGSLRLADALWLREAEKADHERNWDGILASLHAIKIEAERWQAPVLVAAAVRSEIIVRSEYLHDLVGAVAVGESALRLLSHDPKSQFPIRECIGRQYVYAREPDAALPWFKAALRDAGDNWTHERIETTMRIAANVGDPQEALRWVESAVQIATDDPATRPLMLSRVKGELAFARWEAGQRDAILSPLDESLTHLMDAKDDEDEELWRSAVGYWGHNAGYMVTEAVTGKPPEHAVDGSTYAKPRVGNLMHHSKALADWLPTSRISQLFAALAILAERYDNDEIASRRALQALDQAREEKNLLSITNMGYRQAISLVLTGRTSDAMDWALQSASGTEALHVIESKGGDVYANHHTVEELLGPKPSEQWSKAEQFSLLFAVVPAAICISRALLTNDTAAVPMASEVVGGAKIIAEAASDPLLWHDVATVFDRGFLNPVSGRDLVALGNELRARERTSLQCVAYLGATLRPDIRTEDAAIAHVCICGEMKLLVPDRTVQRRLLVPFLQEYWQRVVDHEPFRFSLPAITAAAFRDAVSVPLLSRPRAMLAVVLRGLGVRCPDKYRTWLLSGG